VSFSFSHHHVRLRPRRRRPRRQRSLTTYGPRRPIMNVSALLQESPSGDLRNRQQAQKQQQQQQQLQRQLTPQPQQTHDRRTSFDSIRDHDLKDREREREPDPHRIPSRPQIDLPFPISNSMPKLNQQQSHGPGPGIGHPNDHPSARAPHHQLPPPSSLTGDLPDPGARLPPPRLVFISALPTSLVTSSSLTSGVLSPHRTGGSDVLGSRASMLSSFKTLIFESALVH